MWVSVCALSSICCRNRAGFGSVAGGHELMLAANRSYSGAQKRLLFMYVLHAYCMRFYYTLAKTHAACWHTKHTHRTESTRCRRLTRNSIPHTRLLAVAFRYARNTVQTRPVNNHHISTRMYVYVHIRCVSIYLLYVSIKWSMSLVWNICAVFGGALAKTDNDA